MNRRSVRFRGFKHIISICLEYYEDTNPSEQYIPIFDNIPTFFEYLLETLEERPEVLEKNEAKVFKREINHEKNTIENREINKQLQINRIFYDDNELDKKEGDDYYDDSYTTVIHEYGNSNKEMYKRDLEQQGNGNTRFVDESTNLGEDIKYEFDNDFSNDEVDFDNYYTTSEEHKFKRNRENANQYHNPITMKKLKITAEEVARKALEVEKMLEEYEMKNKIN